MYVYIYNLSYCYIDGSENNPSHNRYWPALVRWSGWHYILSYFSPKLVIDYNETIELLKFGQQHILLSHPHGVNSYNHFILMTDICKFATKYNNSIHQRRELVATILFKLPLLRELVLWLGCIDASKSVVDRALQQGYSIQLYSGGEREQLHSNSIQPIIVAKKRKGIIRLALKYNIPLIPLFTFNEDQCFDTYHTLLPFQLWLSHKLRVALPFATGRYMLPYVPYKVQLVTVVGKPIKLNKTIVDGNYTDDDVNELSDLYIQGMIELFDKYKDQYSQYKINEIKVI